jgi:(p)ppGpp synthase/HD superfamily hydrolase
MRSSGEAYINHPIAVARIVADIGLDEISLAAALLHDAVEGCLDFLQLIKEVGLRFQDLIFPINNFKVNH